MPWIKQNSNLYTHSDAPFSLQYIGSTWYLVDNRDQSKAIPFSDIFNNPAYPIDLSNQDVLVNSLSSASFVNATHLRSETANTPATPGHSFKTEINSGMYRISAGKIGFSSLGNRVGEFGADYGGFTGNVIQSVFAQTNTIKTNATGTPVNVGMPATIMPKYNNSKIIILYFIGGCYSPSAGSGMQFRLYKNGSNITETYEDIHCYSGASDIGAKYSGMFFDSPATTSPTTYEPYFNSRNGLTAQTINLYSYSNIILLEVQQ
jgi:hypothetical protein